MPRADGAIIPVYQGSMLLDPTKTYDVAFTAMPRDFSADATSTSMRAVNSTDTEGDLFSDPPTIAGKINSRRAWACYGPMPPRPTRRFRRSRRLTRPFAPRTGRTETGCLAAARR
ncbi:hypothetical protein MYA98_07900 [Salmonella sp. WGH-01]|nr:hypothetical protein MYA98_07900 [Salmonella sp. WGH-01]